MCDTTCWSIINTEEWKTIIEKNGEKVLDRMQLKRQKQLRKSNRRAIGLVRTSLRLWSISLLVPSMFYVSMLVNVTMARTFDEPMLSIVTSSSPASVVTTSPPPPVADQRQNSTCFYAEASLCAQPFGNDSGCKECMAHPTIANSLICCNVTDIERSISCVQNPSPDDSSYWTQIHIRNATLEELDISHKFWKRLDSFAITDGQVKRIVKEFPKFSSPKCVNVSGNSMLTITPRAFKDLTRLQVLDISNNNLSTMPNLNSIQTNLTLDIRGNAAMLCKSVLELIERGSVNFVDPDSTSCLMNQTFNWFNSTDMMPLRQLERVKQLNSECPRIPNFGNCTCEPERMGYEVQDGGQQLVFAAKVDCSSMGLTEVPKALPMMTISLNISNNSITSLSTLNVNPTYQKLLRVYADDNKITSLLELEASKFIESFDTFYLRRNQLKTIPMYILSNTLDKIPDGRLLYLEGNKLHCDCNSAKTLKIWLIARRSHIPDYEEIACENMAQNVHELSEMKLCQSPHDWTDYIYYLITLEVLLLIALIMKVTYDWMIFKSAGYLPWPASKMPKLPCDCLCET